METIDRDLKKVSDHRKRGSPTGWLQIRSEVGDPLAWLACNYGIFQTGDGSAKNLTTY